MIRIYGFGNMLSKEEEWLEEIKVRVAERHKNFKPKFNPYYTQRDWDRTVGIGKVPEKYKYPKNRLTDTGK